MSEKIVVCITASQQIRYSKIVEIPKEEWEEYQQHCEAEGSVETEQWFSEFAERWIDPLSDEVSSDDYEDVEARQIENGKIISKGFS